MMTTSEDFRRQLEGFGLTMAKIQYYFPDNPTIISPNPLLWQFNDVWPEFPRLKRLLNWWQRECEGPLHSVVITHSRLIKPAEIRALNGNGIFRLN